MHSANLSFAKQISFFPEEPPPEGDLLLIGTIHRVPCLAPLLKKILFFLKPAFISLEISPLSWRLRRKKEKAWLGRFERLRSQLPPSLRRAPGLSLLKTTLQLPYEAEVIEEVARELGIPWVPVDLNRFARTHLRELEGLLTLEGLEEIARNPVHSPAKEMALARLVLTNGISLPEDEEREERLARRIELLAGNKPLVHVGGWRHLPGLLKRLPQARGIFLFQKNLKSSD